MTMSDDYSGLRRELEIGLALAPTRMSAVAAAKAIAAYIDEDGRVAVRLAGLGLDESHILLTLAITVGTVEEIKVADVRSRAAVEFLQRIVDELSAYDPAFVTLPAPSSFEAQAAAVATSPGARTVSDTVQRLAAMG